jgi:hypothetical protein
MRRDLFNLAALLSLLLCVAVAALWVRGDMVNRRWIVTTIGAPGGLRRSMNPPNAWRWPSSVVHTLTSSPSTGRRSPPPSIVSCAGSPSRGDTVLVERLLSSGKFDKTYYANGRFNVPLPQSVVKLKSPTADGNMIRVLPGGNIMVAGSLEAQGFGMGAVAFRLNDDGVFDRTYGHRGTASILAKRPTDLSDSRVSLLGIRANGAVDLLGSESHSLGLPGFSVYHQIAPTGVRQAGMEPPRQSVATPDGGELAVFRGDVRRTRPDGMTLTNFNAGETIAGVADIELASDKSVFILAFSSRGGGRLSVAKFLPSIDPANV